MFIVIKLIDMNNKEREIHEYFNKKLLEIQEEDRLLTIEAKKLKEVYNVVMEKLHKNNDIAKEYFELQKKLRQP
jgi:hypothetical protein